MTPTKQQIAIIQTELEKGEILKVDAKAGSGKTTTCIQFAKAHPSKKILYICFNTKSAAEAREKIEAENVRNMKALNVHALASQTKREYQHKFQTKIHLRVIQKELDCNNDYAWKVQETIKKFCESNRKKIEPRHVVAGGTASSEASQRIIEEGILNSARTIWKKMTDKGNPFPVSFDHYLKIYELNEPRLHFDYILLDEAQDSNPITLSIILQQKPHTRILLIGDSCQEIYRWRNARNAMEDVQSEYTLPLNESFRFGENIANVANHILQNFQGVTTPIVGLRKIDSLGKIPEGMHHTLISRTNATLYETALTYAGMGKKVHFVGTEAHTNWDPTVPYRFNDVLDVYHLYIKRKDLVRNPFFRNFQDYEEVTSMAGRKDSKSKEKRPVDPELDSLCRFVEKYTSRTPEIINTIIQACTSPQKAQIELTTAHRSKGLEWLRVKLANDFTPLIIQDDAPEGENPPPPRLATADEDCEIGEFNLLYVAATRAIQRLTLNNEILETLAHPELFPGQDLNRIYEIPSSEYVPTPEPTPKPEAEPKSDELRIPYERKDEAKNLANASGGKLLWNPNSKTWTWKHPLGDPIPDLLKPYQLKAPTH